MPSNIESFNAGVIQWTDEGTKEAVGKLHQKVTLGMLRDVAVETPVDKGRARANWQVGVSSVPSGEVEDTDTAGGEPTATSTKVPQREGPKVARIKPFTISYVANNVPYIGALNDGHSKQAPAGFVDRVFERWKRAVEGR